MNYSNTILLDYGGIVDTGVNMLAYGKTTTTNGAQITRVAIGENAMATQGNLTKGTCTIWVRYIKKS